MYYFDGKRNREIKEKLCSICGKKFIARTDHIVVGKGNYCSNCCHKPGGSATRKLYPILPAANTHLARIARKIAEKELPIKPCEICDYQETDKHHDDYSKPLEVIWLCRKHHIQRHMSF